MKSSIISRQLQKFRVEDLQLVVSGWTSLKKMPGWNPDESFSVLTDLAKNSSRKKQFINYVLKLTNNKTVSFEQNAELDLLYMMTYPEKKKWSALKLKSLSGKSFRGVSDAKNLKKLLLNELNNYRLNICVIVRLKEGMLWTCIYMDDGQKGYYPAHATYLVLYPSTESLCICGGNDKQRKYIFQALISVFRCEGVEAMKLGGHCIKSLLALALQQPMPEVEAESSRKNGSTKSRKRKYPDWQRVDEENEIEKDEGIVCENATEKRRCREYVMNNFGTGRLPTLETVTYSLETNFQATTDAPAMSTDEPFVCKVFMRGPSVICGLRQLALAGLADLPMKNIVGKIATHARNEFVLKPKTNQNISAASRR